MGTDKKDLKRPDPIHRGDARSSPYPTSRLAPAFDLVELASELEQADRLLTGKTNAQLELIADQIRTLQQQAREILEKANEDMHLHKARCSFRKIPGRTYHLYEDTHGNLLFSMLSPGEWGEKPPHRFVASYRLEADMAWTKTRAQT